MAAATGTSSFINPETGDMYYMPTDVGGGSFGGYGGDAGGSFGGFGGGAYGGAEGKTSNYQGMETPFNPNIGKIEPNILEKAWNYVTDNPRQVASLIGSAVAGPLGALVAGAGTDLYKGVPATDIAKNALTNLALGRVGQLVGGATAGASPFISGAVGGATQSGLGSLLRTGNVNWDNAVNSGIVAGLGRGVGSEFGPEAGSVAGSLTGAYLRGQDMGDAATAAVLGLGNAALNRELFPGAGNLASSAWRYFNPNSGGFTDSVTNNVANLFSPSTMAPGEADRIAMSVGPRDEIGYAPDPRLVGDYGGGREPTGGGGGTSSTTPTTTATAPQARGGDEMLALLALAGLMDGGQQEQAPQQGLFRVPQLTALPGQLPGQLGGQPTSLAELMALLNTRRA